MPSNYMDAEELLAENLQLHEKVMQLEDQIEKLSQIFQAQSEEMVYLNRKLRQWEESSKVRRYDQLG